MSKKFKVGIIGCGRISRCHGMSVKALENAEVAACCDLLPDASKAMAALFGCERTYVDFEEMLQVEKLDAVHICLPHYLHAPVAVRAMEMGCHVLTEKPMAITMEQADSMVQAARKYGKALGVIFQNRYNPSSLLVKQCLDSGSLGKILGARATVNWFRDASYYVPGDWHGTLNKEGGGVIINQAIHTLDLMCWLLGYDIEQVECSLANRTLKGVIEVEDCADGLITFKNGVRASFWCMNYNACDAPVMVEGKCEKGTATIIADTAKVVYDDGREMCVKPNPADVLDYGGCASYWGVSHFKQIRQFYEALEKGVQPDINGELILGTAQRMIVSLYEAGRTNSIVKY